MNSAAMSRRPRRKGHLDNRPVSDAIVFFGATGDLAKKQIFPALEGLVRDEGLDTPIIGVARAGWSLDQLKARAEESLSTHGELDTKPSRSLPVCCALSLVTTVIPRPMCGCGRHWRTRNGRCIISPFRPACLRRWRRGSRNRATGQTRALLSRNLSAAAESRAPTRPHSQPLFSGRQHLPDRSLPWQGTGAEHSLYAVCEFDVRTDLEPPPISTAFRSRWLKIMGCGIAANL